VTEYNFVKEVGCLSHSAIQQPGQQEYRITEVCGCNDDSCPHRGEFEEKGWDDWGLHPRYPYCYKADKPIPETIGKEGFEIFPDWCPLSRPVQASQDSNTNEPRIHENCNFWKIRACKNLTTKNCWNTTCPDHDEYKGRGFPKPTDEQCRICEQAIRKDATGKVLDKLERKLTELWEEAKTMGDDPEWENTHSFSLPYLKKEIEELRKGRQE
jgi:hypothetical protein